MGRKIPAEMMPSQLNSAEDLLRDLCKLYSLPLPQFPLTTGIREPPSYTLSIFHPLSPLSSQHLHWDRT